MKLKCKRNRKQFIVPFNPLYSQMKKRFFKWETCPRWVSYLMIRDLADRVRKEIQHLKVNEEMGK